MATSLVGLLTDIANAIRTKKSLSSTVTINAKDFVDEVLSIGSVASMSYTDDNTLPTFLSNLANAIRLKRSISMQLNAQDFAEQILLIETEPVLRLDKPSISLWDEDVSVVYTLSLNVTNLNTQDTIPSEIASNETITFTFDPVEPFELPATIKVLGASHSYNSESGDVSIYEAFNDVVIDAHGAFRSLAEPQIYLYEETELTLSAPVLAVETDGVLSITNIDVNASYINIYDSNDNAVLYTYIIASPSVITLSNNQSVYAVAMPADGSEYIESTRSNIVTYINAPQLAKPEITIEDTTNIAAPTISIEGDILSITDNSGVAETFDILVNGVVVQTISTASAAYQSQIANGQDFDAGIDAIVARAEKLGIDISIFDNVSNLITFTIDGTSYQAEEGMTCMEWCASDYNTGGFTCSEYLMSGSKYVLSAGNSPFPAENDFYLMLSTLASGLALKTGDWSMSGGSSD